jgi:hypothetical protein
MGLQAQEKKGVELTEESDSDSSGVIEDILSSWNSAVTLI